MKRKFAFLMSVLMVAALFAMSASAYVPKDTVEVKRGTPVIDGQIDAIWSNAEMMILDRFDALSGKTDTTGYVKMLWDEGNIYVLAVINDSTKSTQTEAMATEDCFEAYFDLDNHKTPGIYAEKNQFRFLYDIVSPLGIRNPDNISESYADYLTLAGSEPKENQYVYEFAMNEGIGFNVKFTAGKEIGIDFGYDDNTEDDGVRTALLTWNADGMEPSADPSVMGTVVLVDVPAYVEEAVETESSVPETEAVSAVEAEEPVVTETAGNAAETVKTFDGIAIVVSALIASGAGFVVSTKRK